MPLNTQAIMLYVLLALLPGFAVQVVYFGVGYLANMGIALLSGLISCLLIAQISPAISSTKILRDHSNWVSCALIAIALPPSMPIWVIFVAVSTGLGLGKYAYGGTGQNIFNPAIVGYAIVLISFPADLARWPQLLDGSTGATPLELLKYNSGQTILELSSSANFGTLAGLGWEWINLAYLAGGLLLIYKRIISWHIPLSLMLSIILLSAAWYDMGSSLSLGSPLFHLLSGGLMLTAFFIATDPVTCPSSTRGKIYFGILAGSMIFVIRSWGAYPDGIAFAILLANMSTPLIDHLQVRNG